MSIFIIFNSLSTRSSSRFFFRWQFEWNTLNHIEKKVLFYCKQQCKLLSSLFVHWGVCTLALYGLITVAITHTINLHIYIHIGIIECVLRFFLFIILIDIFSPFRWIFCNWDLNFRKETYVVYTNIRASYAQWWRNIYWHRSTAHLVI